MTSIRLHRPLVNQLLRLAQDSPATEICGFIGAVNGVPARCYPIPNVAAHPARRYRMDPKEQIAALRHLRERGEELFAIYHSHPAAPAAPSAIDIAEASYPDALHLIISLDTQGVLQMRGFSIRAGVVEERELDIGG